jgi:hypothetical protein
MLGGRLVTWGITMRALRIGSVVVGGLLAMPVLGALPAQASSGFTFQLACGGTTYIVTANGNGDWTPARDTASTAVFIPHAFGPETDTIRNASGVVQSTETQPARTQGSGKQKSDLSCTYTISFTSDGSDPGGPPAGWTFTATGTVTGQRSGAPS